MGDIARALVLHVETPLTFHPKRTSESRLAEAVELAGAIDLDLVYESAITLRKIDAGVLLTAGHLDDLAERVEADKIDLVFINHPLTPIQQRNLEKRLNCKVIDRTGLILEIFGARAQTREGVLQVQHAHLKYQKSRLVRSWTHLERQRGGAGFLGGPGETQIEADRRALDEQIKAIELRIEKVRKTRDLQRAGRKRNQTPVVALVGYTNAGKSTLFNRASGAEVLAKDMLFATLDPTMRIVELPSGLEVVFSDTVGFISDLPTELVAAFRATLEEVIHADIIVHVRDISNPENREQAQDVLDVLESLDISPDDEDQVFLQVFNKIDLIDDVDKIGEPIENAMSAITGAGVDDFLSVLDTTLRGAIISEYFLLDYQHGQAHAWLHSQGVVKGEDASEAGYELKIEWNDELKSRFDKTYGPITKPLD